MRKEHIICPLHNVKGPMWAITTVKHCKQLFFDFNLIY